LVMVWLANCVTRSVIHSLCIRQTATSGDGSERRCLASILLHNLRSQHTGHRLDGLSPYDTWRYEGT
jgi:hypothetical protein